MRIHHIIGTMLVALSMVALTSCYEDKGNYDYRDIDEIHVAFPGNIGTDNKIIFAERQGNTLNIIPEVECIDKTHLTYLWERYTNGTDTEILKKEKDVSLPLLVGDDALLQWKVGTYKLRFTVTDTLTQQSCQKLVNITVKSVTPIGVQVLTTTDGKSDISMIENDDFIEGQSEGTVSLNYYSEHNNGEKLKGEGRNINWWYSKYGSALMAFTNEDGCSINMADYKPNITFDHLFDETPTNIKRMVNAAGTFYVYADNNVYDLDASYGLEPDDEPSFESIFGSDDELEYAPDPSYVSSESGFLGGSLIYGNIAYSTKLDKFLLYDIFNAPSPGMPWPMQNLGDDPYATFDPSHVAADKLIGMDYGTYTIYQTSQNQWALMLNNTDNGKTLTLYRFNDEGYDNDKATYDLKETIATNKANSELLNVNCFQMSTLVDGIGFFSTPDGVYSLNVNNLSDGTSELFTPSGNEKVTMIRLLKYQYNNDETRAVNSTFFSHLSKSLYIATWDGNQGRIYRIHLTDEGLQDSSVEIEKWEGFGEIKDMCFRLQ